MGLGPDALHAGRGGRMSGRRAGCPGLREVPDVRAIGPDVRAGVAGLGALWIGGVRMSGLGAGCPAAREEPDVRASGRMSGLTGFSFGCVL